MKNKFASIPTTYKGIDFRSRLEARWAVLFDLFKWEWEYEPIDLNGWTPDFKIKGNEDILVEVKPYGVFTSYPEFDERWIEQMEKIAKADPDLSILLLSNSPIGNESNATSGSFGLLFKKFYDEWAIEDHTLAEMTLADGMPPFLIEDYPFNYKPSYSVKGEALTSLKEMSKEVIERYWNEAGNVTQWKGKANK